MTRQVRDGSTGALLGYLEVEVPDEDRVYVAAVTLGLASPYFDPRKATQPIVTDLVRFVRAEWQWRDGRDEVVWRVDGKDADPARLRRVAGFIEHR